MAVVSTLQIRSHRALLITAACVVAASCSDATSPDAPPAQPHRAASVSIVSGNGQTGVVGTTLPQRVVLQVLDFAGQPAWGRPLVGWGAPDGLVTDRSGHVQFDWTLGPVAGAQTIKLQPDGQGVDEVAVPMLSATALPAAFNHVTMWNAGSTGYTNWLTSVPLARDLLFSPRDTFDNVVPWPADVALIAPAGWTVHGDTVLPPSSSYVGVATIAVKAAGRTASTTITRVEDLRTRTWSVAFSCGAPPGAPAIEYPGTPALDSFSVAGTTAVVAHGADPDPEGGILTSTPEYRFYLRGTRIDYPATGGADTAAFNLYRLDIPQQRPDTLVLPYAATSGSVLGPTVPVQGGATPSYIGGSWCAPALFSRRPAATITATTP
jgi:hypothetical protein